MYISVFYLVYQIIATLVSTQHLCMKIEKVITIITVTTTNYYCYCALILAHSPLFTSRVKEHHISTGSLAHDVLLYKERINKHLYCATRIKDI